jgi:hypothetical protein
VDPGTRIHLRRVLRSLHHHHGTRAGVYASARKVSFILVVPNTFKGETETNTHVTTTSLRSFISALFWVTIGIAAAICIALSPVSQDPHLVWMYASLAVVGFVAGCAFFLCFRKGRKWSGGDAVILEAVAVESPCHDDSRLEEEKSPRLSKGV